MAQRNRPSSNSSACFSNSKASEAPDTLCLVLLFYLLDRLWHFGYHPPTERSYALPFSQRTRKSTDDTTSIEGLREITLYYTVDDGRTVALRKGVLRMNGQGGCFGVAFRDHLYTLHMKELALHDNIGDLKQGKDIYTYISDPGGLDGLVVIFTLFGSKDVAKNWLRERTREYLKTLPTTVS
ncbi:MAG: hypothetical protein U0487_03900 [Patescibacteria group bacterium]